MFNLAFVKKFDDPEYDSCKASELNNSLEQFGRVQTHRPQSL